MKISENEFHINKTVRDACAFEERVFASTGNAVFADFKAVQKFQTKLNELFDKRGLSEKRVSAGSLNAMGLIDEIFHYVCGLFRKEKVPYTFRNLLADLDQSFGKEKIDELLLQFSQEFPPVAVYKNEVSIQDYLAQECLDTATGKMRSNREQTLEEIILLHLANENPAFHPFAILFDDAKLKTNPVYEKSWIQIKAYFETQPVFGPKGNTLIKMLKEPVIASPDNLKGQLDYIRQYWESLLGEWIRRMLEGIDTISEEQKAAWHGFGGGGGDLPDMDPYSYDSLIKEYERFSPDREWMPKVVLMAKTVLVWLDQLSKKYGRSITRFDEIPDEELDALRDEGFTGLWLIGLWERSNASKRIKQINGNPEAAASAYSLLDYEIAWNLGGWSALENLRARCWKRGIRLASDMVPNHTGMDGKWVIEHPDYFISSNEPPFAYDYNSENLSQDPRVSLYLESHYYSKTDCAVTFKRVDNATGETRYIYHGNDGTGLPWNDTAQIDYLNPEAREAVMQKIMQVARNFPIIRFDAAMVLAKKSIRRLWYPEPGHGGDIASRGRYSLTNQEFESRIPNEFWREVVDRCAVEMPDTLLLAEAFWMMEGYFTRTLGMHRVYNSAFMNMLKKEENQKYRDTVKNTIKFDPQILKRFVNFMNNPDEETAVAQFGKGDKYFGVCTLMITMPGLPMFGHGQLEGFEEKYGMEYTKAYKNEQVDEGLMNRHRHDIFPLLHKRYLFSGVENFLFYDVWDNGIVNENIFAYSNCVGGERTIVFYNNKYERAQGWINRSCEYSIKTGSGEDDKQMVSKTLGEAMGLSYGYNHYFIFKEQRSGLWFIRKSDDIINGGMFVMLNGFEAQVYLECHEVEDDADGKYYKLHELLNGRGVEDLEVAWQEYCYKDLYSTLEGYITPEFVEGIRSIFASMKPADKEVQKKQAEEFTLESPVLEEKKTKPAKKAKPVTLKALLKKAEEAALAYYQKETEFALWRKQAVEEALKNKKLSKTVKNELKAELKAMEMTAEEKFKAASKRLDWLVKAYKAAAEKKEGTEPFSLEKEVFEGINFFKESEVLIALTACVASAGCVNLLKWGFARKLSSLSSCSRDEFERAFLCTKINSLSFAVKDFNNSLYETAMFLVNGEYSQLMSGANEYNGIKWFNKERIDSSIWIGLTVCTMCGSASFRDYAYRAFRTLVASKEMAEYKCDVFTDAVKPAEMPKKTKKVKADK